MEFPCYSYVYGNDCVASCIHMAHHRYFQVADEDFTFDPLSQREYFKESDLRLYSLQIGLHLPFLPYFPSF